MSTEKPQPQPQQNGDLQFSKVFIIGVGGATCSGKTTLAKHLRSCLPNSFIIHQDDFAPPQELVPYHPTYDVQDWDDPPGAIDWPRLRAFMNEVKKTGVIPASHYSHDHLNEQKDIPVSSSVKTGWVEKFKALEMEYITKGEKVAWGILDGFLLYWDQEVVDSIDVRVFLRVPHDTLKQRRHERHGYHTAVQSDPEGTLWRDPPHYWEQIVYPAYLKAHKPMFTEEDVENGQPNGKVKRLMVIEASKAPLDETFDRVCEYVMDVSKVVNVE